MKSKLFLPTVSTECPLIIRLALNVADFTKTSLLSETSFIRSSCENAVNGRVRQNNRSSFFMLNFYNQASNTRNEVPVSVVLYFFSAELAGP